MTTTTTPAAAGTVGMTVRYALISTRPPTATSDSWC